MDQLGVMHSAPGEAAIPYEFDVEGDLAVLGEDEERVEALLDSLEFGRRGRPAPPERAIPTTGWRRPRSSPTCSWPATGCTTIPPMVTASWGRWPPPTASRAARCPSASSPGVWNGPHLLARPLRLKSMLEDDEVPTTSTHRGRHPTCARSCASTSDSPRGLAPGRSPATPAVGPTEREFERGAG